MTGQQFEAQNNSHKDQSLTHANIYRRRVYQLVHKMEEPSGNPTIVPSNQLSGEPS